MGRYPYMVSIFTEGSSEFMAPVCGGTLIAPSIVLTAAHCAQSRLRTVHVGGGGGGSAAGRYDNNDEHTNNNNDERFDIIDQIMHPNYRINELQYDIMLLILSGPSRFPVLSLNRDPNIPKENNSNNDNKNNNNNNNQQLLHILGFGVTQIGGSMLASSTSSPTLQIGMVYHVPNSICEQSTSNGIDETYVGKIKDDMMCALGHGVDACQGDSGSALILQQGDVVGQDVQLGVTSWGYRCAHPDFPGVYARVSYFWDWIARHVCQRSVRNGITDADSSLSVAPPAAFKCHAVQSHGAVNDVAEQTQESSSIQYCHQCCRKELYQ